MQDYNTIIGAIQMRLNNCPIRSVMDRYNIGSGTLALIMSRYKASGIPVEELRMMPPNEVKELFYPSKNIQQRMQHFQIFSITMTGSIPVAAK